MRKAIIAIIRTVSKWEAKNGLFILRISLGIIFFWFGFIKFFPGLSTAEEIAAKTISWLTFGSMGPGISMPLLGTVECIIGIGLLLRKWMAFTLLLLYIQMLGTLLPLFIFRNDTWTNHLFVPTLLGQYIIKNCVLIAAGIVLGATLNGGGITAHPVFKRWLAADKEADPARI
jgi:uncharacterized membrane protein YkgB